MTITVFGATGMVGKELVKQSLFKGYKVRAYGRNVFTAGLPEDENLELLQGTLFDDTKVRNAIKGCDAVFSALGGAFDGTDKTRSLGMKHIVEQMKATGVNRIIAIGGMGVLPAPDGSLIMESKEFPEIFLPVSEEHLKAYRHLLSSGLAWTFVCPPDIKASGPTGEFHTEAEQPPASGQGSINAGDLALFMLQALEKGLYLQQRAGISN